MQPAAAKVQTQHRTLRFICASCQREYRDPQDLWECAEEHLEERGKLAAGPGLTPRGINREGGGRRTPTIQAKESLCQ